MVFQMIYNKAVYVVLDIHIPISFREYSPGLILSTSSSPRSQEEHVNCTGVCYVGEFSKLAAVSVITFVRNESVNEDRVFSGGWGDLSDIARRRGESMAAFFPSDRLLL